jgi:hypothetical protein
MSTIQTELDVNYIINSNRQLFNLTIKGYTNGNIVFNEPSEEALKRANKDLELFTERQNKIYERTEISMGDYVIQKNGQISRITVYSPDNLIQVGGNYGGSFYIGKNGRCSYSGSCGDVVDIKKLQFTGEYKEGSCWIFSNDWTGANRGVYYVLKFKVYREL